MQALVTPWSKREMLVCDSKCVNLLAKQVGDVKDYNLDHFRINIMQRNGFEKEKRVS